MPQVAMVAKRGNDTGSFVMELDPVRAPKTVDNFLTYVNTGSCFYKGTLFHRVIANFMSQAGGFNSGLQQVTGQGPAIELESKNGLSNLKYTVAMARTNVPNSATSEFFINAKDNLQLDYVDDANPGYAVFGKLISGMEAVDVLNQVPTMKKSSTTNGVERIFDDAPIDEVMITACGQTR
ncbi:MAG: peptidylprolyl isomerase [Burkholderiales bacterium]|nr:peptidylprolyl isomerase [Burkholderiales bacterium]